MIRNRRFTVAALLVVVAMLGCAERKPQVPAAPVAMTEPLAEAECAAPITDGPPKVIQVGTRAATLSGTRLRFTSADTDGQLVLGVLGPINEDSGQNLLALKKYLAFFAAEKVDAVVVTGDVGEQPRGITRVLKVLGATGLPVLVTIGNGECRVDFTEGLEAARAAFPNIVNLTQVREVAFAELTLLSLPGYHDPAYIKCKSGCQYRQSTVDELVRAALRATTPVGLISHGPPRGTGGQALDYAQAGGNVGDEAITKALGEGKFRFGFFSNIKEAGARAVSDAAGTTLIKEGEVSATLFLNPGPADSTQPWPMNDGAHSVGNAAVFTLKGGEASWKALRLKPLSAAEKAEAKALERAAND